MRLFGTEGDDGIEDLDDQVDLFVEFRFANGLKLFLAALGGPFRLCYLAVTGEVGCNGIERHPAAAGDRPCRAKQGVAGEAGGDRFNPISASVAGPSSE